ncbi:ABC transporter ATP-binding protein [Sporolactobacillus shoreae]|uniref:ABC transporter ATP-binding protein n=1 Tax=Sporolactobacillus shoreae TaxID=1465501 RepID=A0A4Z0GS17_9BACL|nr:ABC transporter ATP-binding protein [Sporolactobacillus shoreae]TGA99965.1 ABC transporter ATP-binding protein [Sporolactobacillus shoreae]
MNLLNKIGLNNLKQTFQLLLPYLLKHRAAYAGLLFTMTARILLTIAFASFYGRMTDTATHGNLNGLTQLTVMGVGLLLVMITINYLDTFFECAAIYGVKRDLKVALFRQTLLLRADTMAAIRSGDLISRFDNDMNQIEQMLGSRLVDLIRLPLVYLCVFTFLFHINPVLSLISWAIAPAAIGGSALFGFLMRRNSRQINDLAGENTQIVSETLQGFSVVRSFVLERSFFRSYSKQNRRLYRLEMKNANLRGLYNSAGQVAVSATFLASLCLGAYFVSNNQMSVGALVTFITLVNQLVFPLMNAAGNWAAFQKASGSIERIQYVLNLPIESGDLPDPVIPVVKQQFVPLSVEFDAVSFYYKPGKPVLSHFTLSVPAGKKTAIVGFSGAGKTTLFSLLMNFYHPQSGFIRINGRPLNDIPLAELRGRIAHVPQDPTLFNGTIRENLLLGRERDGHEIEYATRSAMIHDFICSLPDGYDTPIGERGIILSGGQKQRLAIARAMLKDAPILLLDEATSALDGETEHKVKSTIDRLMVGRTTLVIAHRLSTIRNADKIVVMENGKIVQEGTHSTLMAEPGLYRRLYQSDFVREKKSQALI